MGNINLNILGLASGSVVLDAQGQVRRLSPGEQPAASDVIISFDTSEESVPSVSARFVDNQGQQNVLDTDDAVAQVQRAIEEGFDPTELGDEFDTAAGEEGSSLTNSGRIERTGAETQAATNFETEGFESQGLSETQSIALFDIIAFALISGETNVIEFEQDEPIETGGALTSDDPDVTFIGKEVAGDNELGTFVVNEDGTWTFVANSPYDELADGEQIQDTTTVQTSDGGEQVITVTIIGTDDAAVATDDSGSVTEDIDVDDITNQLVTSGQIVITDVDSDTPTFSADGEFNLVGSTNESQLGVLSIDPDGAWTYVVNNDDVQYLDDDEFVTEVYTVTADDGTTSEVTITINGADDPSDITVGEGDSDTGEVTEDVDVDQESNNLTTSGTLTITDVDDNDVAAFEPDGTFNPEGSTNDTALGMLTITDDGEWTYVVDNDNVQYLDDDEFVTEVYTVTAIDGTTSEVTITINGADDPSEITVGEGDSDMGEVTEDVDVDPDTNELSVSGTLTITDVDTSDMPAFKPNGVFTPIGSTYALALGMLTITPEGAWSYVVDNDAVQYLNDDDVVIERYVVTAIDGVEHVIEITINGVNDAPEATSFTVVNDQDAVIPILFDSEDGGMPDYISDVEDDHDDIPLNIRIESLPTNGSLLYTDENGVTREIMQSDVDNGVLFVPNNISFVAGPGEMFEMGFSGDPEDIPDLVDGFYNWGVEVSPTERLITLDNGNTITLTIEDNNNKPLKQYQGEQPHVGFGIGDTDGSGMNKQETLVLDFTNNPLEVVDFGLDGLGGSFNTDSNVYVEVLYTFADGTTQTEQYQKDPGDTGNSQILYDFSYSSPDNPIVGMELSSTGGSWELRYVQGNEAVTEDPQFDYVAVDSNGAESTVETVTIDIEAPQQYNVISAASNEPLYAESGNDLLIGDSGDNIFTWLDSALDNGTDIIKDFELYTGGSGDLINLNDLVEDPQDETQMAELLDAIEVSVDGEDIALSIPINGGDDVQTIVVEGIATGLAGSVDLGNDLAVLGELIKNDAA
ncbi:VCBS domain-containing protein [Vibrio sp. TMPB1044]|uniref:VCBS domain-containing protein n=1 Tax=Vibrio sp. TMPB1044 TaxID=3051822 RepID=UPI00255C18FD|nr:VCBS domain-containing protein [Vibrio sp. TMPB1044]MDL5025922.1 VCBS domain-containing protein [Vibrio sp. TMPB1044]MDN5206050.1 VCBS domain-containing protein [Vibrio sp. TMPB1044]